MAFPTITVECMFNDPTWTDISAWTRGVSIRRGASRVDSPLLRYEAGTATIRLDNRDRRFDPTNLAGPYVSGFSNTTSELAFTAAITQFFGHGVTVAVKSAAGQTATVSAVSSTASGTTSSFSVPRPAGTVSGRIMLAFHSCDTGTPASMTVSGGSAWTTLTTVTSGDDALQLRISYKVTGGSEPANYTFGQASGADGVAAVVLLSGADTGAVPVFAVQSNPESSYFVTPGVTPAGEDDLELRWVAGTGGGSGNSWTVPDGYTERVDAQSGAYVTAALASAELSGYGQGTATRVVPMRPIRIRAVWNAVTYDLFRGYVDTWDVDWQGNYESEVTVPCTDAFKIFGADSRTALGAPVGAGEDSGARVNRILDSLGWSASDRVISTGNSTVQGTTLEGDSLAELQTVADTEIGELYVRGDGKVVFRNRQALVSETRSTTVQATFGGDPGELPYHEVGISYDDVQMANRVKATREGGAEQVAEDIDSIDEYTAHTFERSGLLHVSDGETLSWAQWLLHLGKSPELRFDEITIRPIKDETSLFPQVLGREIGDRIAIKRQPPGGGDVVEREVFIRGIEHTIEGGWRWETRWVLQSATQVGSFFTLGHATLGVLGANALVY
ncbi:hypothetical protein [Planobispora rosea]|uniref:hypothetical protein n=1 Tax=Planobispora rosea TaxID=35762 RepID=UPI00083A1B8C|nr:hypothetical protein [Planobispora rosea]